MLLSLGHGQQSYFKKDADANPSSVKASSSGSKLKNQFRSRGSSAKFAYFFPDSPAVENNGNMTEKLQALADAMIEQNALSDSPAAAITPVYTYMGQFIGHDVMAIASRDAFEAQFNNETLEPIERARAEKETVNLCQGSLNLNSLYGDRDSAGGFSEKLSRLMRFPADKAKMRLGAPVAIKNEKTYLPNDKASDLLRINKLMAEDPSKGFTLDELRALPEEHRSMFLDGKGNLIPQRAVIADARNDQNLNIAQLQVAFLRFHNRTVDWLRSNTSAETDTNGLFNQARQLLTWHFQWLVVHDYLKGICREDIHEFVVSQGAALYSDFYKRNDPGTSSAMPIPFEFSAAAFRFGHSMVRGEYDFNRFYGTAEPGTDNHLSSASLNQLFAYTGSSSKPMPVLTTAGGQYEALPSNWVIEWDRFVGKSATGKSQSTRKIDTLLSPPLSAMAEEIPGSYRQLAMRDLSVGQRLNLPCAQACVAEYNSVSGAEISYLSRNELLTGGTASAVAAGGFDMKTPLWFYVLKEAEVRENGERLGMLGSALVAETLVGLIVNDAGSYWNARTASGDRWHPMNGVRGATNEIIDSIPAFLRFAGVL